MLQEATADPGVWKWLAITFAGGFFAVILAIVNAALREKKHPARGPVWAEERGAVLHRLGTVEGEVQRIRDWKHDRLATILQAIVGDIDKLEAKVQHLEENR